MPRGVPRPELKRGQVFGNWTVLRESWKKGGQRRYLVRATCCGREVIKFLADILRCSKACVHCKGDGKGNYREPEPYSRPEMA